MQEFVLFIIRRTWDPVGYVHTDWVASRHDTRTGRGANGTGGIAVIKLHARLGQTVDVGGFVKGRAKGAHVHHSHIINEEEDKICLLLGNEGKRSEQRYDYEPAHEKN